MSFGLNPNFTQHLDLGDMPGEHYLALAIETAKAQGWSLEYISKSGLVALTPYSFSKSRLRIEVLLREGQAIVKSECVGNQMYDWGRNKKNVGSFLSAFEEVQNNTSEEELHALLAYLNPVFTAEECDLLDGSNSKPAIKSFFSFFIPVKGFVVTPLILDINVIVFILMVLSGVNFLLPDNDQLLAWGASFRPFVLEGQYWRLITSTFIHIGILHLVFNMYALLYIGVLLEPYLGTGRFVAAYLFTGLVASVTSIYWHELTVSAGASGAIFGLYGVFLALLTTNFIDKTIRKSLLTSITVFVLYNLANGMKAGIDNAAHMGGLISGFVIGFIYYPSFNKPAELGTKRFTIGVAVAFAIFISLVIFHQIPGDLRRYSEQMNLFAKNEESALEIFKMKNVRSEAVILDSLHSKTYTWKENLAILDTVDQLKLPKQLKENDIKLREYCNLRLKSYQYIYKKVEEKTNLYDEQIKDINLQIASLLKELNPQKH